MSASSFTRREIPKLLCGFLSLGGHVCKKKRNKWETFTALTSFLTSLCIVAAFLLLTRRCLPESAGLWFLFLHVSRLSGCSDHLGTPWVSFKHLFSWRILFRLIMWFSGPHHYRLLITSPAQDCSIHTQNNSASVLYDGRMTRTGGHFYFKQPMEAEGKVYFLKATRWNE